MKLTRSAKGLFSGLLLLMPGVALADNHELSIVVIPDTQKYTESYPAVIEAQMQWIVDNRDTENIIFVAHLGDLKDDINCNNKQIAAAIGGFRTEWDIIDQAFIKLENETSAALPNGIPFSTVAGNHDYEPFPNPNGFLQCPKVWGDPAQRVLTNYIQRFGPLAPPNGRGLSGRAYYGGTRPPNPLTEPGITFTGDSYSLFESNGVKFIAINLAYRELETLASPPPEQQWASQKLQEHSDRIGIVTSHFIMECNYSTAAPAVAGLNNFNGDPWNGCNRTPGDAQNVFSEWGAQLYQSLKDNPNLFMMLGAHRRGEAYRIETRANMQPVHAMLVNYQNTSYPSGNLASPATFSSLPPTDPTAAVGNSGFMRIMRFDIDTGTVDIETFSPPVPQTAAVTSGNVSVANCQNPNFNIQPTDVCNTPAISARNEVKSVYTPANPTVDDTLHTATASNITDIDFTGYTRASVVYDATTGYATGIRNLEINGTSYNVEFVDASYNAAYASSPPLFLDDAVGASAAADAIQAVLNAEATVPEINASPNEIVWVPLQEVSATQFRAAQTGHDTSSAPWQRFGDFIGDRSVDWTPWFFTRFTDIGAPP